MRAWTRSPPLSLALAAALAMGCNPPSSGGGTGGSAGSATSIGSGGAGGASSSGTTTSSTSSGGSSSSSSGAAACSVPSDCPGFNTACGARSCDNGACGLLALLPAGTILNGQTAGDCLVRACDGAGHEVEVPDIADVPAATACALGACGAAGPTTVPVADGTACGAGGKCLAGACQTYLAHCANGVLDAGETDRDCGGACPPCAFDQLCAADADCADHQCVAGKCTWTTACPGPAPGPAASWASCAAGLDPTKAGGELLWATTVALYPGFCTLACGEATAFAVGPTGDVLAGTTCGSAGSTDALIARLDGAGRSSTVLEDKYYRDSPLQLGLSSHNDLVAFTQGFTPGGYYGHLRDFGPPAVQWDALGGGPEPFPAGWFADPLGNVFADAQTTLGVTVAPGVHLPASPDVYTPVDYLLRGDASGTSFLAVPAGISWADGAGGVYRTGPLPGPLDLGCGLLQPAGAGSGYLVRLGPSWACAFATALPVVPGAIADGAGGVYLAASSSTALDLGCGPLPAAPGGSLFVTRLDGAGHCLWGRAFVAPALTLALTAAPGGRLVLSGAAGSAPVDLGAGALPALGAADEVLAELGPDGATLWSRRLGAPGVTFTQPVVSVSAAGDVYLLTGASGPVDLGGGPLPAGATLVASYTPTGGHRWSRTFAVGGKYTARVDGCGALVLTSADRAFDPGCGRVIPDSVVGSYLPYCPYFWPYPNGAVARFQP